MSALWTLETAVALVRRIEDSAASVGWHAALGGSALHRGQSDKDVDVIVFPHKVRRGQPRPNIRALRRALREAGLSPWMSRAKLRSNWAKRKIRDDKWVEIWVADGRSIVGARGRVDILVLS